MSSLRAAADEVVAPPRDAAREAARDSRSPSTSTGYGVTSQVRAKSGPHGRCSACRGDQLGRKPRGTRWGSRRPRVPLPGALVPLGTLVSLLPGGGPLLLHVRRLLGGHCPAWTARQHGAHRATSGRCPRRRRGVRRGDQRGHGPGRYPSPATTPTRGAGPDGGWACERQPWAPPGHRTVGWHPRDLGRDLAVGAPSAKAGRLDHCRSIRRGRDPLGPRDGGEGRSGASTGHASPATVRITAGRYGRPEPTCGPGTCGASVPPSVPRAAAPPRGEPCRHHGHRPRSLVGRAQSRAWVAYPAGRSGRRGWEEHGPGHARLLRPERCPCS